MADRQMIRFEYDGAFRSIDALIEHLENPKPVLRLFSRQLMKSVRDNIKAGGSGWPPYAQSTLARMGATGTSQITKRGTIRSRRVKRTMVAIQKQKKTLEKHGWSQGWQDKQDRLVRRLASYEKALAREHRRGEKAAAAQQTLDELRQGPLKKKDSSRAERARKDLASAKKDRLGKRESETRKLLQNMPGTIRSSIKPIEDGMRLTIYSKAGDVGGAHNEGEGATPQRRFLPPPGMAGHMDTLAKMLESDCLKAWESGK